MTIRESIALFKKKAKNAGKMRVKNICGKKCIAKNKINLIKNSGVKAHIKQTIMKTKIGIKSISGNVLFSHECENNTIKKTVMIANLSGADLSGANLSRADLSGADLSGADLDYSCLSLSCKSRKAKTDEKQRVQLAHHLLSWMKYAENLTDEEKTIFEFCKNYANKFHRTEIERF